MREDIDSRRDALAQLTRRGIGMTLAACVYWLALAAVSAWAGLRPGPLALFFLAATPLVYPLGWLLNRAFHGDLLARGHEFAGLIAIQATSQTLAWPMFGILFFQHRSLIAFALAALLGAHYLPYGWLYRSPAYYALGCATVLVAAALQWWLPQEAMLVIPLGMAACYALATLAVFGENRRALSKHLATPA
jgi:hypothetical protein